MLSEAESQEAFYCMEHYKEVILKKCSACGELIASGRVVASSANLDSRENFYYHEECFRCQVCKKSLRLV